MRITAKVKRLVDEYLIDLNATQAAIRAGYSPRTAKQIASETLAKQEVQALVQERQAALAERTEITQDAVLNRLWAIATADPTQIMQFRRTCCRYCYGKKHGYQWTKGEYQRAVKDANDIAKPAPECDGGFGFDPRKPPVATCTECFGQGHGAAFFEDTRNLRGAAKTLFSGVKQGKEGLEMKTLDQVEALKLVGQHLGMFKTKVEHSGANGQPLAPPVFHVTFAGEEGDVGDQSEIRAEVPPTL